VGFVVLQGVGQAGITHRASAADHLRLNGDVPVTLIGEKQITVDLGAQGVIHPRFPVELERHSFLLEGLFAQLFAAFSDGSVVDVVAAVQAVKADAVFVAKLALDDLNEFISPIGQFFLSPPARDTKRK
jgi:hypothetical protein